jgi:hypothetical protein
VINVIVLLNLLIAMMSNSYAMIDVSADAMWSPHNKIIYTKLLPQAIIQDIKHNDNNGNMKDPSMF